MSEKAFQLIERIFTLESAWKDLPPEKRLEHRQKELKPVLDAYWEHLNCFEAEEKAALYKAQRYPRAGGTPDDALLYEVRAVTNAVVSFGALFLGTILRGDSEGYCMIRVEARIKPYKPLISFAIVSHAHKFNLARSRLPRYSFF